MRIDLAISTCPNDTFAFHGILSEAVDTRGLQFDVQLLDIAALNEGLFQGRFDVAKASFHAAVLLSRETVVLPAGSALGFGVGPLVLAAKSESIPGQDSRTLCPGKHTTATMLFRMFYPAASDPEHVVFSDIMPALQSGSADFGVCIHEGRFTWEQSGLHYVTDLGTRWEEETGQPLPLGGILARRSLGANQISTINSVIRDSIEYGLTHPDQTLPTMRKYAQEFDDKVLMSHVDLYVNDWTVDLGEQGRAALKELSNRAMSSGIVPAESALIEVAP